VTTNETIRPLVLRMLEYLETVHRLREQPVCDIAGYQVRYWWAGDIPAHSLCVLTATGDKLWSPVSKAQLSPSPPIPEDIAPNQQTGINDAERERALATDFDVAFADDSGEAARLWGLLRGYVAGLGSMKTCTTFACGFRVSPQASRWFGTRHLELTVDAQPAHTCNT
jgi:hypothetical protein